jgi:hypothetical protein
VAIEDGSAQHLAPDEPDPDVLTNLDTIAAWLRLVDPWPDQVDLASALRRVEQPTWRVAADVVTSGRVGTLMLVGGRGHTTDALMTAIGVDLVSSQVRTVNEAELMADRLTTNHGIEGVILETESTNCGNRTGSGFARTPSPYRRSRPRPDDAAPHGRGLSTQVESRRCDRRQPPRA